jgi:hypothetical protein
LAGRGDDVVQVQPSVTSRAKKHKRDSHNSDERGDNHQ